MYFQLDDMLPFTVFCFLLFSTSAQQSRDTIPFPPPTSCLSAASRASGNGKRREEPALSCTATSRSINPHRRRAPRPPLLPPLYSGRADSPPLFFTIYDSILLTLRLLAAAGFRMGNTHLYSHRAVTKSRRQIGKKEIFFKKPSLPRGFINNRLFAKTQRNWAAALATSRLIVEWEFINRLHLYMLLLLLHGKDVGGGGRSECQVFFSTGSID